MSNIEIELQVLRALLALRAEDYTDAESILKNLSNKLRSVNNIFDSYKEESYE